MILKTLKPYSAILVVDIQALTFRISQGQ